MLLPGEFCRPLSYSKWWMWAFIYTQNTVYRMLWRDAVCFANFAGKLFLWHDFHNKALSKRKSSRHFILLTLICILEENISTLTVDATIPVDFICKH